MADRSTSMTRVQWGQEAGGLTLQEDDNYFLFPPNSSVIPPNFNPSVCGKQMKTISLG